MSARITRLWFVWLAAALLVFAGCGQLLDRLLEEDYREPPVKNEPAVLSIGKQFGEAIQQENYPAAYQLLTNSRRAEQTLDQFTATCKQRRQEYLGEFKPSKVDTVAYMLLKEELADWPSLPTDLKYDSLLGVCEVSWQADGPDLQVGETEPYSIEIDVVVVDEAGQPKIAHIDWADDY
jgi:hypothetical protein